MPSTPAFVQTYVALTAFPRVALHESKSRCRIRPQRGFQQPCRRRARWVSSTAAPASVSFDANSIQSVRDVLLSQITSGVEERGIFGADDSVRGRIDQLCRELEVQQPYKPVTDYIDSLISGKHWRLIYTTVTLLGSRRTRLAIGGAGKKGFVTIGDIFQNVSSRDSGEAVNTVKFHAMGGGASGEFKITAKYAVVGDNRVNVEMTGKKLAPDMIEKLLGSKVDLLTEIFDPSGYMDITYVDETIRIGRDDKDNLFILEAVLN